MNYENFENIEFENFNNNDIEVEENFKSKNPFKKAFKSIGKTVKKVEVGILGKKNSEKLNKGLSNIVKKSTTAIIGKKNQQKLAKLQNNILGVKKKSSPKPPPPPKPIVYALNQNNFNNNMYYDIFCPQNDYNMFENKTFNKTDTIPSTNEENIINCKSKCTSNPICTSFTYNKNTKNCTLYKGYPSSLNNNQNGNHSGIKTNLKYSYKNLNSNQKKNIQKHCINKRFKNLYSNQKLDIRDCFNQIKQNKSNDYIDLNAQCVWSKVNELGKGKLINKSERVNKNKIGNSLSSSSMNKYQTDFTNYLINIQNYFNTEKELNNFDDKFIKYNNMNNNHLNKLKKKLEKTAEGTIALNQLPKIETAQIIGSTQEKFENYKYSSSYLRKNSKEILCILILLILVLIILYIKF